MMTSRNITEKSGAKYMTKIAVAMSGGVDSSVAAALMADKYGQENVFGLTMKLFCYGDGETPEKSCCSLEAINDAKKVCDQLDIPHYVVNFEKEFEREVIANFISEYEEGHTPNPCIRCNQFIKFEYLLKKAKELGADKLATGHYARIIKKDNNYLLLKGEDKLKDQSYFLYTLDQEALSDIEFPIGEKRKTETRKIAAEKGLKTAQKTESQDICFISGTVEEFLEEKAAFKTGNIVDLEGKVVGEHRGLAFYTIGQRRGLGGGFAKVMYVVALDRDKNEVIIGPETALFRETLEISSPHWIESEPKMPFSCTAKIRYQAEEAECTISRLPELDSGSLLVTFPKPQRAITPGQSIVFYSKDEVVGGGIIT
jgi:tRNA-specific 2-thiouridylase